MNHKLSLSLSSPFSLVSFSFTPLSLSLNLVLFYLSLAFFFSFPVLISHFFNLCLIFLSSLLPTHPPTFVLSIQSDGDAAFVTLAPLPVSSVSKWSQETLCGRMIVFLKVFTRDLLVIGALVNSNALSPQ